MTSTKTTKSFVKYVRYYSIGQKILHYQAGTPYYIISQNYYIIWYIIKLSCSYYYYRVCYYIIRQILHRQEITTFSVITNSVEVSITHVYTSLFNRVPRRCHNGWNWFWRSQMALTASAPSACWCCVTNVQLFQVIVDCPGDGHWRFRGALTHYNADQSTASYAAAHIRGQGSTFLNC